MCYFCSSTQSMESQGRKPKVFLLTALFPRLRWRFCRHCNHHYMTFHSSANRA